MRIHFHAFLSVLGLKRHLLTLSWKSEEEGRSIVAVANGVRLPESGQDRYADHFHHLNIREVRTAAT